jgi:AcrR family transcriptional regulator
MSGKPMDRRIGKTRNALADALFRLIQRDDWNVITIQRLCDEADVARASFYAHFGTKVALLDFMLERNLGGMAAQLVSQGGSGDTVLAWFVEHVTSSRSRFSKIVLAPDAHPALARFKAVVAAQYADALKLSGVEASEDQVGFIMGGTVELVITWSRSWRSQHVPTLKDNVLAFAARVLDAGG